MFRQYCEIAAPARKGLANDKVRKNLPRPGGAQVEGRASVFPCRKAIGALGNAGFFCIFLHFLLACPNGSCTQPRKIGAG